MAVSEGAASNHLQLGTFQNPKVGQGPRSHLWIGTRPTPGNQWDVSVGGECLSRQMPGSALHTPCVGGDRARDTPAAGFWAAALPRKASRSLEGHMGPVCTPGSQGLLLKSHAKAGGAVPLGRGPRRSQGAVPAPRARAGMPKGAAAASRCQGRGWGTESRGRTESRREGQAGLPARQRPLALHSPILKPGFYLQGKQDQSDGDSRLPP